MLPPRCIQPPCRNIEVRSVDQKGSGIGGGRSWPALYSRGTTPQAVMNDCSAPSEALAQLEEERQHVQRDQRDRDDPRALRRLPASSPIGSMIQSSLATAAVIDSQATIPGPRTMAPDPETIEVCDSLYVSPHGDDVLLSCAARLLSEASRGLRVTVVTMFAAAGGKAYFAVDAALDRLGVRRLCLDLPEASRRHGSYSAFEALTDHGHPDDVGVVGVAAEALHDMGHRSRARQIYIPLGVGGHVDHRLCHEASLRAFESGDGRNVYLYEDRPEAFVRGAVRMRLGHVGAQLPPGAVRAAEDTGLAAFLLRYHVGPSLRGDLKGWGERARGARVAARLWREARSWKPGKGWGPRLQPLVHSADPASVDEVKALVSESASSARAGERMAILAARYARRLGASDHAERLWLLLPDHAGSGRSSSAFQRSGSWSQSVLR